VVQTSWSGEQFELPSSGGPTLQVEAWMTEDSARRVVKLAGQDLDALRAAAQKRDFRPVPLGVRTSVVMKNDVTKKQTANVIGRLPGSDAKLASEAVIVTAHHDHLGVKADAKPGEDAIYNGALDNATGLAALLTMAEVLGRRPQAPRRTVLFAAVGAEEQGLLGSAFMAAHPPLPLGRAAATINIDGVNVMGPTRDIEMIGLGKSSLDDVVRAIATRRGRTLEGDQFPDRGYFYRSDQFNFAKAGVPAVYLHSGTDVIGKPAGWGKAWAERFEANDYHQPSDEMRADWSWEGAAEDVSLTLELIEKVSNADAMPTWKPGDEFEAARKKALAEAAAAR
jgi:Zn-dependent M28 family amino/carboxypeptidase